jgi:hypothetical protein
MSQSLTDCIVAPQQIATVREVGIWDTWLFPKEAESIENGLLNNAPARSAPSDELTEKRTLKAVRGITSGKSRRDSHTAEPTKTPYHPTSKHRRDT